VFNRSAPSGRVCEKCGFELRMAILAEALGDLYRAGIHIIFAGIIISVETKGGAVPDAWASNNDGVVVTSPDAPIELEYHSGQIFERQRGKTTP